MSCTVRLLVSFLTIVLGMPAVLQADEPHDTPSFPDIAGPEQWIDGPDAVQPGTQRDFSDVAVDNLARRIHVWGASGGPLDNREIFLRRFDAAGNPFGDPEMVNTTTAELQDNPRLAVAADGSFLVVFESREEFPTLASGPALPGATEGLLRRVIRSQAYDDAGNPVGSEQLLSTVHTGTTLRSYVDVAALRSAGGAPAGFAVVWESSHSVGSDSNDTIQGCMVAPNGAAGSQFQVNSDDGPQQRWPAVTELQDGGFLAVWSASDQVWGRRFDAAGNPVGDDFQISTAFDAGKEDKDAAIGWNGDIAIVWSDDEADAGTNGMEIRMRLYDADLVPRGLDFRVNSLITDAQRNPRVAEYGPEGYLVTWESEVASGSDQGDSIEARLVQAVNAFAGPQVQYNTWDDNRSQQFPSTHGWYGQLATDWNSPTWNGDPMPANPNADFIIGRTIDSCLFCDDFDWYQPGGAGNLWRWSAVHSE